MRFGAGILIASMALGCSSGGGAEPPASLAPGDHVRTLDLDGRERRYELHVPPAAQVGSPRPLLLAFHGLHGDATEMRSITRFDALADQRGFVVAYPEAAFGDWANGCTPCGSLADELGIDDVAFVRRVISSVNAEIPIDRSRVYAAGISNGALFVQRLACDAADAIAGFASVAATALEPDAVPSCAPARAPAVLFVHGTADPLFPAGGRDFGTVATLSIDATVTAWVDRNACTGEPVVTPLPDGGNDGTTVRRIEHAGCAGDVVLYAVEGGGHVWPGAAGPSDLPTSDVLLDFFLTHSLGGDP